MKQLTVFLMMIVLTSCAYIQKPTTLSQVRMNFDCIELKGNNILWAQVFGKFGYPDIAPLPEPGTDLTKNARIYQDKIVILYTELQEVKVDGQTRFDEVITNIEVCGKKR